MKVGILTYHSSHNYGAFLQSYALANALMQCTRHNVEIIDFTMAKASEMNRTMVKFNRRHLESLLYNIKKFKMFEKSKKKWLPLSSQSMISDDLDEFRSFLKRGTYDVIIVGSDELWKMDGFRGFPNPYWLPGVKNVIKISYAVSARNCIDDLQQKDIKQAKKFVSEFSYLGVRDTSTKLLVSDLSEDSSCIYMNCDPTFAFDFKPDKDRGKEILKNKFHINIKKKCIGLMCGVPGLANQIINKYKKDVQIISLYYYYRHTKGFCVLSPFEWIDVIAALDGLITTFFHGMVFALLSDTPFLVIENRDIKDISTSKNYDLLKRSGLEDQCVRFFDKDNLSLKLHNFIEELQKSSSSCNFENTRLQERKMFTDFISNLQNITNIS